MPRKLFRCSADSAPRVSAPLVAGAAPFTCDVDGDMWVGFWATAVAVASPVAAQSPIGVGTSAGVVKLTDQRSEEALSGVLEYQPNPWLTLYAIPAVLHLSDNVNGRPVSSSGLGDLPLVVAASYASPTSGSPTVGAALVTVLPTGNAACGLVRGQTAAGLELGVAT